jgi:hypothetical protein
MMHRDEIINLLSAISAYDNRNASNAAILAWTETANRGRWTFREALDAIHAHYAEATTFLMPGHVTQLIKARRQDAALRTPTDPPDRTGQKAVAQLIKGAFRSTDENQDHHRRRTANTELDDMHDAASSVECPRCGAPIEARCMNPTTGHTSHIPCLARIRAVDEVSA